MKIYKVINSEKDFIDEKYFATKKEAMRFADFTKYSKKSEIQIPNVGWGTGTYLQKVVNDECIYEKYFNC